MTDIVYIDEEEREANKVARFAVGSGHFEENEVYQMAPLPSLEETVQEILSTGCGAVITDYRLGEMADDIDYTGTDLIRKIRQKSRDFPCFVTTSYPEDAIATNVDSLSVYFKEDIDETDKEKQHPRVTFFQRVRKEVDRYRVHMSGLAERHAELVKLSQKRELNPAELEEFIEIDSELEADLSYDTSSSAHAKMVAFGSFEALVSETRELIEEMKANLDARGEQEEGN